MVDVNFGFLCHELEVVDSFLSAKGIGFDTVMAPHLPLDFPPFWAVISLRFGPEEMGEHSIRLRIEDIDGNPISAEHNATITPVPSSPTHFYRNHREQARIVNLTFPAVGDYIVTWSLDDNDVHRANIAVLPPGALPPTTSL